MLSRILLGLFAMSSVASAAVAAVMPGDYRLSIATELGELPINLRLENKSGAWTATFINGPENMKAEATQVSGDGFMIEFPSYGSKIAGQVNAKGDVTGAITFTRAAGTVEVPFTGKAGVAYRFFPDTPKEISDMGGRWALTVPNPDGTTRPGIGEFTQDKSRIYGAVMYTNADSRWLAGEVRGNEFFMSTFDGGTGSLWRGKLSADGTLSGRSLMVVGNLQSTWTAKRDAQAALPDPTKLTYLKPGYDKFAFTFPDLDGKPVSLEDPRFKGKVTIITIGGSWCPTCHDEAAFMSPYIRENRARGVEGIALMYEFSPEFPKAVAASRAFAKRYAIDYPMLISGTSDKQAASRTLPMINAVLVYPTMIIVDRKGVVRHIHTSFPGPATGVHHENFKKKFYKVMDSLLAEGA